jgi:hypothetical protein
MIATLLTVLRKELRETFRDRRTLVSSLLMGPLLAPLLLVGGMQLSLERSLDSVDQAVPLTVAGAERAPELLGYLRERGITITPREGSPEDIAQWVANDKELVVRSEVRGSGDPIQLDYRLEKTAGQGAGWRIYNLNVLGVWLVDNYRTQFSQEINAKGVDGLIATLVERNKSNSRK